MTDKAENCNMSTKLLSHNKGQVDPTQKVSHLVINKHYIILNKITWHFHFTNLSAGLKLFLLY
jgi:hypothetical protein